MPKSLIELRMVSKTDQSLPCSATHPDRGDCTSRATFVIFPTCSHSEREWPWTQSCSGHLAQVIRSASARCTVHFSSRLLQVREL